MSLATCDASPLLSGMGCKIEVLFAPAEFRALRRHDLTNATCVVFDVLRATSTIVTALANGATAFIPVEEISEAIALRRERPDVLLAGERNGLRINSALTGGIEFDLGNSPREFSTEKVSGRTIISTTTNGTRALRSCVGAETIVVGSFLNLSATRDFIIRSKRLHLLLVCAGTGEKAALEDTLAAGALCDRIIAALPSVDLIDSADIALMAFRHAQGDLPAAIQVGQNARRLLENEHLREDVEFCLHRDSKPVAAVMDSKGVIRTGDVGQQ